VTTFADAPFGMFSDLLQSDLNVQEKFMNTRMDISLSSSFHTRLVLLQEPLGFPYGPGAP
jgi:hypothetical protein